MNLKKIAAILLSIIIISTLTLFAMKKISAFAFWMTAAFVALITYFYYSPHKV